MNHPLLINVSYCCWFGKREREGEFVSKAGDLLWSEREREEKLKLCDEVRLDWENSGGIVW